MGLWLAVTCLHIPTFAPMEHHKPFIQKCIELSQSSLDNGDAPFGSIVVKDGEIIAESTNYAASRVSDHAEVVALHMAHEKLGTSNLDGAILYSNCEPCPMCSFMAREYKVAEVVYALPSPYMGGHSKWNIMEDDELEQFPPFFGKPPKVTRGVLEAEAKAVFDQTPLWMFGSNARK